MIQRLLTEIVQESSWKTYYKEKIAHKAVRRRSLFLKWDRMVWFQTIYIYKDFKIEIIPEEKNE